ncbi:hypothetical protein KC332_g425 [Hortaea werneckii]|nr:hypothetical protein KC358_g456 [Hortaea werneckii]KAI6852451.1 hypothetical protein KC350_g882 [Hortaea werneckii]KAI6944713.1 hypothetical protein KC341_g642 [Hortaea werneckii]KAI6950757.1 hypothetical protein KC348_g484 [Hortaea werneckii]KAI6982777.1 hypothetical protein KC321_g468 [Hortaea werneckii]
MAYVFALNNGYTSREHGYQTYHLVPSEAPMPPRPVTPPAPSEWIPGTVLERDPEPPVRRPWTPKPVVEPNNGRIGRQTRPKTPEPDELIAGMVLERSPETPEMRPGTPERLTTPHDWKTLTQQASPAESGKLDEDTAFPIEDPKYYFGFIGEEPSNNRPNSNNGNDNSATLPIRQAQSVTEHGRQSLTSLRFNPEHIAALLRYGQIDGLESATRLIKRRAQDNDRLSTSYGAQIGRFLKELRSAALQLCDSTSPSLDVVDRASQVLQGVQPLLRILTASFAPIRFFDCHGQQIRNRAPNSAEVQIYVNRYAVGEDAPDLGIHINRYIEDLCVVMDMVPAAQQVVIGHALARPRRLPFQVPPRIGQAALASDDAYMGIVLPTLPGTTEYLVDENGSRLSSRDAIRRHGETHMARFLDAHRRGISTTQGYAEIGLQFTRLRNLYHFTASPHLILVADWYNQFLTSFDEPSLWNMYPDDTPATSFP